MLGRVVTDIWQSLFHRRDVPPDDPAGALELARAAAAEAAGGNRRQAVDYAERALERDAQCAEARTVLMNLYLPGRVYDEVLADIHAHLRPRSYVEIGVSTGKSLRLALPETLALGVDPNPAIRHELSPNTRVFKETSNDFFSKRDVRAELGGLPLALAFIDGLHWFEYSLQDFIHLERLCSPRATILVHDGFPIDRISAQRERESFFWSGDVWRLVVLLKKYRPDLRIHTIATPPTGLVMIRGLDPSSRFLADNLDRLVGEHMNLGYDYLREDRAAKLNLVPNEWDGIRLLLDEPVN